ncbi:MAG: hypothetical protein R3C99_08770 [Pirellulaceae bacterium]
MLITSAKSALGPVVRDLRVDVMSTAEAKKLLRDRTKQKDNAASERIVERVGCLRWPWRRRRVLRPVPDAAGRLRPILEQHGLKLLDRHRPGDYHSILSKTWEPSFEQARQNRRWLSRFWNEPPSSRRTTSLDFYSNGTERTSSRLHEAFATLGRYSLIELPPMRRDKRHPSFPYTG